MASHASQSPARKAASRKRKPASAGRRKTDPPPEQQVVRLEIYGILILAFAAALFMALITFDVADIAHGGTRNSTVANAIGPIGAHVANLFLGGVGVAAFALCGTLGFLGLSYIIGRRSHLTKTDVAGWIGVLVGTIILVHVMFEPARLLGHLPGGIAGAYAGEVLRALLSTPGTYLAAITILVISAIALTRRSLVELSGLLWRGSKASYRWTKKTLTQGDGEDDAEIAEAPKRRVSKSHRKSAKAAAAASEKARHGSPHDEWDGDDYEDDYDDDDDDFADEAAGYDDADSGTGTDRALQAAHDGVVATIDKPEFEGTPPLEDSSELVIHSPRTTKAAAALMDGEPKTPAAEPQETSRPAEAASTPSVPSPAPAPAAPTAAAPTNIVAEPSAPATTAATTAPPGDIKIVENPAMHRGPDLSTAEQLKIAGVSNKAAEYELPSVQLLDYRPPDNSAFDRQSLRDNAQILEKTLEDYKVKGRVVEIHPGPVVTMYEFQPAPGIKISRIAGLSDDLAMALSALRIRIVAPIPGKNVVGIEVPNTAREIVYLKEIISDQAYRKSKSKLTLAFGKDIAGNPYVLNLAKAPHMLVAGATGAGKSVAINAFICSLLYNATPDDVRLIMVDPKMLELSIYEGIPHLLLPVVTDPKQATVALRWAVKEMERRYKLMADLGVRNLEGYNKKVESLKANPSQAWPERLRLARIKRTAKGEVDPDGVVLDCDAKPIERLPFIVVIVDELADLMMVASKDVEHSIARLAQMARASGIHLILATQRPSVDVITGLIKANFPTRVSFQVASKIDSRTILDTGGAQNLLGMGDMLVMPPGTSQLNRVHGAYVSEEEVHRIVEHLKTQGQPDYDLGILVHDDEDGDGTGPARDGDEYDELYDRALHIVAETRNASISFLQRKLKIGYNRSARIVEKLEEEGIIGPSDGTSRPREVFIDPI